MKQNINHLITIFWLLILINSCSDDKPEIDKPISKDTTIQSTLIEKQWYLHNNGSGTNNAGLDINIKPVWEMGYTGKNINIAILDSYVDNEHPNLKNNIKSITDYHFGYNKCEQKHGTPVTGIIAANNSKLSPVGIAHNATIHFHSIYSSNNNKTQMASIEQLNEALSNGCEKVAVYNNSWSYTAGGYYISDILKLHACIDKGTSEGFGGKGSSYIYASGNAGFYTLGSDAMLSHPAIIAVSGVKKNGEPHILASKKGLQHWVSAFSDDILTLDRTDKNEICGYAKGDTTRFSGTSAAAPMVTGVVALMREANPNLSWRDCKLILAETARNDQALKAGTWHTTGASLTLPTKNYKYAEYIGFGLVDAEAAVTLALNWKPLPAQRIEEYTHLTKRVDLQQNVTKTLELELNNSKLQFVEFMQFSLDFISEAAATTILSLSIVDPKQNEYEVLSDKNFFGQLDSGRTPYKTGYNLYLGKHSPNGKWKLKIKTNFDDIKAIENLTVRIYGH